MNQKLILIAMLLKCILSEISFKILELNQEQTGSTNTSNHAYFSLKILEPQSNDLVISLTQLEPLLGFCDLDFSVSKNSSKVDSNPDFVFAEYGPELALIPNTNISKGDTFYLSVYSSNNCSYRLLAQLKGEVNITDGMEIVISKKKPFDGVFYNEKNQTNENLSLEFNANTQNLDPFKFVVSTSENINITAEGNPSFLGGQSVVFKRSELSNNRYCVKCKYFLRFSTEVDYPVQLKISIDESDFYRVIKPNNPIYKTIDFGRNCYVINSTYFNFSSNIIISTTSFSGNFRVGVKFNEEPDFTKENKYDIEKPFDDEEFLKIDNETIKNYIKSNLQKSNIYFCVESAADNYNSYELRVFMEDDIENTDEFSYLAQGIPVNSYLPSNRVTKYRVMDFSNENNITIQLESKKGKSQLYGYFTQDSIFDRVNMSFVNTLLKDNNDSVFYPENMLSKQVIKIDHKDNLCHSINNESNVKINYLCGLMVLVVCQDTIECSYRITYKATTQQNLLIENQIQTHLSYKNDYDYFKLIVPNDTRIDNLTIMVNSIMGDSDLYVSKSIKFPNETNYDKSSTNPALIQDAVIYKKPENITGEYYIGVHSVTFSTYSILFYTKKSEISMTPKDKPKSPENSSTIPTSPENKEKNKSSSASISVKDFSSDAISLHSGITFKQTMRNQTLPKIYSFNTNFNEENKKNISITLYPRSGYDLYTVKVYTSKENLNLDKYLIKSDNNNMITFGTNSQDFKLKNKYFIKIDRFEWFDPEFTIDSELIEYDILYTTQGESIILTEGNIFKYSINENYTFASYVYYYEPDKNDFFISVVGDYDFYFNVYIDRSDIKDFKDSKYVYYAQEKFYLNGTNLTQICGKSNLCSLFIKITFNNSNYQMRSFEVVAKQNNLLPSLYHDGLPSNIELLPGEIKYYYKYISYKDSGVLVLSTQFGSAHLYANIIKDIGNKEFPLPNAENSNLNITKSLYNGELIGITEDLISQCDPYCILVFGIKGVDDYGIGTISFSIKYQSKFIKLQNEKEYKTTLLTQEIQIFRFFAPEGISNIYLSFIYETGGSAIYINQGYTIPGYDLYNWKSLSFQNDFFDIQSNEDYFTKNEKKIDNSFYTIAAYSFVDTKVKLFLSFNPIVIQTVGVYSKSSCQNSKKNGFCYFKLDQTFSYTQDDVNSKFDKILASIDFTYGSGRIFASKYNLDSNIYDSLPNSTSFDFSSENSKSLNFLSIDAKNFYSLRKNDKIPNFSMVYGVECEDSCLFKFIVDLNSISERYIEENGDSLFYMKANSSNSFNFYYSQEQDLSLNIYSYYGKVNFTVDSVQNKGEVLFNTTLYKGSLGPSINYISKLIGKSQSGSMIFIKASTMNEESSFSIKMNYVSNWNLVELGKSLKFNGSLNNEFFGYFYFSSKFKKVSISVYTLQKQISATLYVNFAKVNGSSKIENILNNNRPNSEIHEFTAKTNLLQKINIDFDKFSNLSESDNYVGIFTIVFENADYSDPLPKGQIPQFLISIHKKMHLAEKLTLMPNQPFYDIIWTGKEGATNVYEIKEPDNKNDYLLLDISFCNSNSTVEYYFMRSISQIDIPDIKNSTELITDVLTLDEGGKTTLQYKNKPKQGNLYLIFKSHEKTNCSETNFSCNIYELFDTYIVLWRSVSNPFIYLPRNKSSEIEVIDKQNGKYDLKWNPLMMFRLDDSNFIPQQAEATYNIYYNNSESPGNLVIKSLCALSFYPHLSNKNLTEISVVEKSQVVDVNVIGKIENSESTEYYVYKSKQLIFTRSNPNLLLWFVIVLLIFIGLLLTIYLFLRYKWKREQNMLSARVLSDSQTEMNVTKKKANDKYLNMTDERNQSV